MEIKEEEVLEEGAWSGSLGRGAYLVGRGLDTAPFNGGAMVGEGCRGRGVLFGGGAASWGDASEAGGGGSSWVEGEGTWHGGGGAPSGEPVGAESRSPIFPTELEEH